MIGNKHSITRRTFLLSVGKIGFLFLLAGRMFYMQFLKKDEYKTLSEKNRIKLFAIFPERGEIFDYKNRNLARNESCFYLMVDKGEREYKNEVKLLSEILDLDEEQVKEIKKRLKYGSVRIPTVIIDCMDWTLLSAFEEEKRNFKTIFIDTGFSRFYPNSYSFAHILGYINRSNEKIKTNYYLDQANYKVGKSGIEKQYEKMLCGSFGYKKIEVNAKGRYVRELDLVKPVNGKSLVLNIDSDLQNKVMSYLSEKGCSAIIMDCNDGGIRGAISSPSYDLNKFNRLSNEYWQFLNNNIYRPLVNKTIRSLYPPGSIFKVITMIAALESGIDPEEKVTCTGKSVLNTNSFRCARSWGHGPVNMIKAIKYSCNHYVFAIARKIGADKIIEVAKRFGLGSRTNIDLPGELKGFIPTRKWKKDKYKSVWTIGDTFNLAIGQGFSLVTPMQLTRMMGAIATGGKLFSPRVLKGPAEYVNIDIGAQHLDIIKNALYSVMNSSGGTGYLSRINNSEFILSGKTGTAQVIAKKSTKDNLSRDDIAWESRNHAIFSGFVPHDNPQYIINVYFDHGGGGGRAAAPIAKKIVKDLYGI